jgi:hypothetical protein
MFISKVEQNMKVLFLFLKGLGPKDKNTKKTKPQYYAMENYDIMNGNATASERDYLIHRSIYEKAKDSFGYVDIMKIRRLANKDDLFDIIWEHHLHVNHAAKRITWLSVKESYSNISHEVCGIYVALCQCKVNQRLPACPEGIKPILSNTFNDRGQMDLMVMQSNIYDQDHLTKFLYL